MPIFATHNSPTYEAAGYNSNPTLGAAIVTVAVAVTAGPGTPPDEGSTPVGASTAITSRPAMLISFTQPLYGSRSGPLAPVPSSPSMTSEAARRPDLKN